MKTQTTKVDFKRLRDHAKANRWTANAIAREIGVTPGTLYAVFRGKSEPSAATLKKVCDTIGLPIEDAFMQMRKKAA